MLGQQLFPAVLALAPTQSPASPEADAMDAPVPGAARALEFRPEERGVVLSARESQILRCLVEGASNKEIARRLQVTETTVKAHVKGLLRKVRASNRTQAAIWALNNDVLAPEIGGGMMPPAMGVPRWQAAG
jgi:two-component system nitrate/nitrite response regulator NarL